MIVDVHSFHSVVALFTIITTIFVNGSNHTCSTTRSCIKQNVLLGVSKQYACLKYPCGFIANTDPSSGIGTLWISIYISSLPVGVFLYLVRQAKP